MNLAQLIPTTSATPSPAEVERRRRLAQQLAGGGVQNAGPLGALSQALAGTVSGYEDRQASEMETAGRQAASEALARALSDPNAGIDVLAQAATDPFTTDRQGAIAQALIGQNMQRNDPSYQLDMDLKRAQLAAAQAPAQPDPFTLGEGQIRYSGDGSIIAQGLAPGGPETVVNNNLGGSDKFQETLDVEAAKTFNTLMNEGQQAQVAGAKLGQLEALLGPGGAPQGAAGAFTAMAANLGLPVEGANEVQAAEALINQLVPQQRPAGSGTMSDADLALFKASLPKIMNQPGGNQLILQTMRAINEYTVKQGEIATAVATGRMSPADGRNALYALPNPLAQSAAAPSQGGAGDAVIDWSEMDW